MRIPRVMSLVRIARGVIALRSVNVERLGTARGPEIVRGPGFRVLRLERCVEKLAAYMIIKTANVGGCAICSSADYPRRTQTC